ncbi:MAG: single-stranded-DNA-specific exonuclease RecJ [Chloroflexota bacterium]
MLQPRAHWVFPESSPPPDDLVAAAAELGLGPWAATLLMRRGVTDAAGLAVHLGEPRVGLHDPRLLPDADRFLARVEQARDRTETTLVFGDFDADGITGLAVLTLALRAFGVTVIPYVPSRLDEGHGLSLAALDAAEREGARLLITVDTGTTSIAEIAAAQARGIDVLVTDHHRVPVQLPNAVAIVNAHRPESRYPDRRLSGAGIAFTLGRLLLGDGPQALALADLAAIGTIADVAPILGENRSIVRLGLDRMRAQPRPGISALLAGAGVATAAVDVETLAFAVAPRLNAAGRVGEAMDAARLLLTEDPDEASALAAVLETANLHRRDLTRQAVAEARTSPDALDDAPATIVRGPWPVGVVGLVAARLADERGRPAIVGAEIGEVVRASCRGDGTLHLADTLAACGDLLIRHGGHAGAAGFEIEARDWGMFRERFMALALAAGPLDGAPVLDIDLALPALEVDYRLHAGVAKLGPWGVGNPEPLVAVLGLTVTRAREAAGGHTQLVLKRRLDVLDGIAFGWPELAGQVHEGDRVDVVARLVSRKFGGVESLQLDIRDVAPAGFVAPDGLMASAGLMAPDGSQTDAPDGASGPTAAGVPGSEPAAAMVGARSDA